MMSVNKIEKLAKSIRFKPDELVDKRILKEAEFAFQESLVVESKLAIVTSFALNRIIKYSAAAVVVFAIGLIISVGSQNERGCKTIIATGDVSSRLDYIKVGALNRAYKEGGLEGVEENYRKAFQGSGSRPESLTTKQLLAEFNCNGKNPERGNL